CSPGRAVGRSGRAGSSTTSTRATPTGRRAASTFRSWIGWASHSIALATRPRGWKICETTREKIHNSLERIEAECRGDRRPQIRIGVDVVEDAASIRRLEVLDSPNVELRGPDDLRRGLN